MFGDNSFSFLIVTPRLISVDVELLYARKPLSMIVSTLVGSMLNVVIGLFSGEKKCKKIPSGMS